MARRQRLTRREWMIRIVAIVVAASFLGGILLTILSG